MNWIEGRGLAPGQIWRMFQYMRWLEPKGKNLREDNREKGVCLAGWR